MKHESLATSTENTADQNWKTGGGKRIKPGDEPKTGNSGKLNRKQDTLQQEYMGLEQITGSTHD